MLFPNRCQPMASQSLNGQPPHPPHFIHRQHSVLQQDLLNLRLLHRIRRIHICKHKLQIRPSQPSCKFHPASDAPPAVAPSAQSPGETPDRSSPPPSTDSHPAPVPSNCGGRSNASAITRNRNSCHCNRKSASVPPAKPQHLRLVLHRKNRHPPRTLDLILPPPDQPLVMLRRQILQPQRILAPPSSKPTARHSDVRPETH